MLASLCSDARLTILFKGLEKVAIQPWLLMVSLKIVFFFWLSSVAFLEQNRISNIQWGVHADRNFKVVCAVTKFVFRCEANNSD